MCAAAFYKISGKTGASRYANSNFWEIAQIYGILATFCKSTGVIQKYGKHWISNRSVGLPFIYEIPANLWYSRRFAGILHFCMTPAFLRVTYRSTEIA